jgi:hypothetical protein
MFLHDRILVCIMFSSLHSVHLCLLYVAQSKIGFRPGNLFHTEPLTRELEVVSLKCQGMVQTKDIYTEKSD